MLQHFYFGLVLSHIILITNGNIIQLESNTDYKEISTKVDGPYGILFYHNDGSQPLQSRILTIMEEAWVIMGKENGFMKFAMINCVGPGIDQSSILECKHRRAYYAYKGKEFDKFDLRVLYNVEAFLAQMMMYVFADDVGVVTNQEDWMYEQNQAINQKRDLLMIYITGLGDKSHYYFMVYAVAHLNEYRFAVTTDKEFIHSIGATIDGKGHMFFAKCSDAEKYPCLVTLIEGKTDSPGAAANAILNQKMPLVLSLKNDGLLRLANTENINIVWCFVDDNTAEESYGTILKNVITVLATSGFYARGVIVDRSQHKNLSEFGIYDDTILPFVAMELSEEFKQSEGRQFEMFPPDSDFNELEIGKFATDVIQDLKKHSEKIASIFEISVINLADWKQPDKQNKRKMLAHGCSSDDDYKSSCGEANSVFRRITRTLIAANVIDIDFYYVDHTGKPKSSIANKIPSIRLYLPDKEEVIFVGEDDVITYENLLSWISQQLSMKINWLPSSGSDFALLGSTGDIDVNKENLLGRDDVLTELEEDEVAIDAINLRRHFYVDETPQLTDKNFNSTVNKESMVVTFFYTEWDDKSFLFQPIYSRIFEKIKSDEMYKGVFVGKVDCHASYLTCLYENVMAYPLIRIFKDGKFLADYNDVFDEVNVLKSIHLYNQPSLKELAGTANDKNDLLLSANHDNFYIVAYFQDKDSKGFRLYKNISHEYHGRFQFFYTFNVEAKKIFGFEKEIDIIGYLSRDHWKIERQFNRELTFENLKNFIEEKSLPYFGELTAINFPRYRSLGNPLLIIFTSAGHAYDNILSRVLYQLFEESKLKDFTIAWMDIDVAVTKSIRRSYLGHRNVNNEDLVIVDHGKGEVYWFDYSTEQKQDDVMIMSAEILMWLTEYQSNDLQPTSYLHTTKWKPRREGFDFLHYIDHGLPRESDDDDDEDGDEEVGNYGHYKPSDRPVFHGLKAPKSLRNSDAGSYYERTESGINKKQMRDEL